MKRNFCTENITAKHKLFGEVEVVGIRKENESNNNLMYLVKKDSDYHWVYDYETEINLENLFIHLI